MADIITDNSDQNNSVLEGLVTSHGDDHFEFELKIDNSADFDTEHECTSVNTDDKSIITDTENALINSIGNIENAEARKEVPQEPHVAITDNPVNEEGIELQLTTEFDFAVQDSNEGQSLQEFSNLDLVPPDGGSDSNNQSDIPSKPDVVPDEELPSLSHNPDEGKEITATNTEFSIPVFENSKLDTIKENHLVSPDCVGNIDKEPDDTENISLEDLLKKHKDDDDASSGSEFDFELPSTVAATGTQNSSLPDKKDKAPAPPAPVAPITTHPSADPYNKAAPQKEQDTSSSTDQFESGKFPVSFNQSSLTANISLMANKIPNIAAEEEGTANNAEEKGASESVDDMKKNNDQTTSHQEPVSSAHFQAQNDWDCVQTIEAGFTDPAKLTKGPGGAVMTPLLSYEEFDDGLKQNDYSNVMKNVRLSVNRRGFSAIKHILFGPPKLNRNLLKEKELIFCLAASPLDNNIAIHTKALQAVYRSLTGSRFDCSRFGAHWEEVGFQGNDPSTDLRGTGLFGLLNLVHLLRTPKRRTLAQDIYKLSLHPTQNFPFCVMGINMSRITIQTLREDCLNKECNKRQEVMSVANDFYAALYLDLYQTWKSQGKTVIDSGPVIKALESSAKKNPQRLIKNMEDYIERKKSAVNLDNMDIGGENFLSVCDTEAGQY